MTPSLMQQSRWLMRLKPVELGGAQRHNCVSLKEVGYRVIVYRDRFDRHVSNPLFLLLKTGRVLPGYLTPIGVSVMANL